ncbi:hypothetical protein [Symbiopectobacterium purcellii]|uniref:Peptidase M48 domain-containing protein n=1 Tax=Symbiopectobacterium purcellii TaxID=2871826 RepID=A0ABX9AFZ0_9ENTR|nr:hypothetical protein [Symbiopectobacterium purcellii]QZN94067.1 hypothetical protein K6K13_11720 [Symbiopectobacterium purcellii]
MEQKFTYDMFLSDVKSNQKQILDEGIVKVKGAKIYNYIKDDVSINSSSRPTASDQYTIAINSGVLLAIFDYSNDVIRPFYKLYHSQLNVTEELFVRFVCGVMADFIFWHELSHIIRGHFDYLGIYQSEKPLSFNLSKLGESRVAELDADIYGASLLFLRVLNVINSGSIRPEDALCSYTVGLRSIFEILHNDNELEDLTHHEAEHPHSQARAFNAFSFGVTSPDAIRYSQDKMPYYQACAEQYFLDFERLALGNKFNIEAVSDIMPIDVSQWLSEKEKLDTLSRISDETRTFAERLKSNVRYIKNWLRRVRS